MLVLVTTGGLEVVGEMMMGGWGVVLLLFMGGEQVERVVVVREVEGGVVLLVEGVGGGVETMGIVLGKVIVVGGGSFMYALLPAMTTWNCSRY